MTWVHTMDGRDCVIAVELARFRPLLHSGERDVYEPRGQDRRSCQYLAVADPAAAQGLRYFGRV